MCVNPPAISASIALLVGSSLVGVVAALPGVGPAIGWMPHTRTADSRKVAALRRKTTSTLVVDTSSAPSAGPTKKARLSMVLDAPLAAVSSSGRRVSDGIQAIWAGRKTQPMSESSVATTRMTAAGASMNRQTVATAASAPAAGRCR